MVMESSAAVPMVAGFMAAAVQPVSMAMVLRASLVTALMGFMASAGTPVCTGVVTTACMAAERTVSMAAVDPTVSMAVVEPMAFTEPATTASTVTAEFTA